MAVALVAWCSSGGWAMDINAAGLRQLRLTGSNELPSVELLTTLRPRAHPGAEKYYSLDSSLMQTLPDELRQKVVANPWNLRNSRYHKDGTPLLNFNPVIPVGTLPEVGFIDHAAAPPHAHTLTSPLVLPSIRLPSPRR
jgi:hypothetical protein